MSFMERFICSVNCFLFKQSIFCCFKYVIYRINRINNIFAVVIHVRANNTKMTEPANYLDKRTGIAYTNVVTTTTTKQERPTQPHLDAFIPSAFLKTYFAGGKSKI